jgi:hypothetical protein
VPEDRDRRSRATSKRDSLPTDPRKHAARLLEQADRLAQLAHELRREARRLNASLGVPVRRPAEPPRERRFAPNSDGAEARGRPDKREPEEPQISEGARLLITNMAVTGSTREEILGLMEDELGLENADAILDRLSL